MKQVQANEVRVGETYYVDLSDCCVEAHFTAQLTGIVEEDAPYPNPYFQTYVFSNGVFVDLGAIFYLPEEADAPE